jgi:hypothetical protein
MIEIPNEDRIEVAGMLHDRLHLIVIAAVILHFSVADAQARELTFAERVDAERAIASVYYRHQIGSTRSFREAIAEDLLEARVRSQLKQSVALRRFWNTQITPEMLQRETRRMARHSLMPDRLQELYSALGHDPIVIQECLARPLLARRLMRNFFTYDETIHGETRAQAVAIRDDLVSGRIDRRADHPNRRIETSEHLAPESYGGDLGAAGNWRKSETAS